MKIILSKTLLTAYMLLFTVLVVYAQNETTFYVCSGTEFTLSAGGTGLTYSWKEGATELSTTSSLTQTAATLASSAPFTTKTYQLIVTNSTTGCASEPVTYTVNILPPITVNITGADAFYCADATLSDELTAVVTTGTLPANVAADQFTWTVPATETASTTATQSVTVAGTYSVSVAYSLPGTIGGSKIGTCVGTDSEIITISPTPTVPTVTMN